jgi:SAM-dependent methyltransferase
VVTINCPLCDHDNNKRFYSLGNRLFPLNISMCRECGFVFQNPRFSEEEWEEYHKSDHDTYHRPLPLPGRPAKKPEANAKVIEARLLRVTDIRDRSVLDIGAGAGDMLDYLRTKNSGRLIPLAIEPSNACQQTLKEKNIRVIGSSIKQFCDGAPEPVDIIVLRHVLEHLYYPQAALSIIKKFMKENSVLYISVPNLFTPDGGMFHFPHISYFNKTTLNLLAIKANLSTLIDGEADDEIYSIYKLDGSHGTIGGTYKINREITADYLNNCYDNVLIKRIKRQLTNIIPKNYLIKLLMRNRPH